MWEGCNLRPILSFYASPSFDSLFWAQKPLIDDSVWNTEKIQILFRLPFCFSSLVSSFKWTQSCMTHSIYLFAYSFIYLVIIQGHCYYGLLAQERVSNGYHFCPVTLSLTKPTPTDESTLSFIYRHTHVPQPHIVADFTKLHWNLWLQIAVRFFIWLFISRWNWWLWKKMVFLATPMQTTDRYLTEKTISNSNCSWSY